MRIIHPFLNGSVGIKNEKNGTLLIVKEDEVKQLIEQLITLHRRLEDANGRRTVRSVLPSR